VRNTFQEWPTKSQESDKEELKEEDLGDPIRKTFGDNFVDAQGLGKHDPKIETVEPKRKHTTTSWVRILHSLPI